MDELEALMTGGDDYITKPYQAPVLLAHIRAVLRRTGKSGTMQEAELECRGVRLSLKDASVTFQGKRQDLLLKQREDWDICYEFTGISERQSACLSGQDFVHAAAFLLSSVSGEPVG